MLFGYKQIMALLTIIVFAGCAGSKSPSKDDMQGKKPTSAQSDVNDLKFVMNTDEETGLKVNPDSVKQYNRQGILIKDLLFPKYLRHYYDNGILKYEWVGKLYYDDHRIRIDSGEYKAFFPNGEKELVSIYKNKQRVAEKQWNSKGMLVLDQRFDNLSRVIFEKSWNDKGVLVTDVDYPSRWKIYNDNGVLEQEIQGELFYDRLGEVHLKDGTWKDFYEDGSCEMVLTKKNNINRYLMVRQLIDSQEVVQEKNFDSLGIEVSYKFMLNGLLRIEKKGVLYGEKDSVDTGYEKEYHDNGKLKKHLIYENKKVVSKKEWNEKGMLTLDQQYDDLGRVIVHKSWNDKGVLISEMDFPRFRKKFYDNGVLKDEMQGVLFYDSSEGPLPILSLDSGENTSFYPNGKKRLLSIYKNKNRVATKKWNSRESLVLDQRFDNLGRKIFEKKWNDEGTLVSEIDFPRIWRKFYDNGKLKEEMHGVLFFGSLKDGGLQYSLDCGEYKTFYSNGKKEVIATYKNKSTVEVKMWNEKGMLTLNQRYDNLERLIFKKEWNDEGILVFDFNYPSRWKTYYDNGVLKKEVKGELIHGGLGEVDLKDGTMKTFYDDGSWKMIRTKKNNVNRKWMVRDLIDSIEFVREINFDSLGIGVSYTLMQNGRLEIEKKGVLSGGEDSLDTGYEKGYYNNGKLQKHLIYENKKIVSKKEWDEQGRLVRDVSVPNYYREYYDDGKLMQEVVGTIVEENGAFKVKDGVIKAFDPSGKVHYSATYKDFQVVSEKNGDF